MQSKSRTLRLVLAHAAANAAKEAMEITGRSINDLPEYFMSVSIARYVHQHFKTLTFSMEDSTASICESLEIESEHITRPGNVDIAIRSQRTGKVRHVVELKRGYGIKGHLADIERLAELSLSATSQHPLERNYMVIVASPTESGVKARREKIEAFVRREFSGKIELICEPVPLEVGMRSTRKGRSWDKALVGEVWEVRYKR